MVEILIDKETYKKIKDEKTNLIVFKTKEKMPSIFIHVNNQVKESKNV